MVGMAELNLEDERLPTWAVWLLIIYIQKSRLYTENIWKDLLPDNKLFNYLIQQKSYNAGRSRKIGTRFFKAMGLFSK